MPPSEMDGLTAEIGVLDQVVLEQRVDRKLGARTLEV